MDLAWLTPALATALAAGFAVIGTLLGVFIRGAFDNSLLLRQLNQAADQLAQQRELSATQLDVQREVSAAQLEVQRDQFAAQLEFQHLEARRSRAEVRALSLLDLRRQSYGEILTTMERALSVANDWRFKCQCLAETHPDRDWRTTPSYVSDPLGTIASANADNLSDMEKVLAPLHGGLAKNPAWLDARPAVAARNKYRDLNYELMRMAEELKLITPESVYEVVKINYDLPEAPGDPEAIEELYSRLLGQRSRFLVAARADLGGDVGLDERLSH